MAPDEAVTTETSPTARRSSRSRKARCSPPSSSRRAHTLYHYRRRYERRIDAGLHECRGSKANGRDWSGALLEPEPQSLCTRVRPAASSRGSSRCASTTKTLCGCAFGSQVQVPAVMSDTVPASTDPLNCWGRLTNPSAWSSPKRPDLRSEGRLWRCTQSDAALNWDIYMPDRTEMLTLLEPADVVSDGCCRSNANQSIYFLKSVLSCGELTAFG